MAAGFSIVIGATDNASATIERLNKRMAALQAPAKRLQGQLSKFADLSGISGVAKGFASIGRGAMSAFQSVARVVAPLGAITGAASIAGMYRLVESWASWAQQLGFTAQRIGIAAGSLQTLQGAAQMAGAGTDAMRSGLQALGQTMYDAIGGRAPETTALMNQLGIAISDGAGHARSVTDVLPQLADKISSIKDPYTQARVATQLFGGAAEALLPFLRKGSAGMTEYQKKAASFGITSLSGIDAAGKMQESFAGVSLSVTGLTNSIAERLAPVIGPMLDQMATWVSSLRTNKGFMDGLSGAVQGFGTFIQNIPWAKVGAELEAIGQKANSVAQFFGGWRNVLLTIMGLKVGAWATSLLGPFASVLKLLALVPGSGVTSAALGAVGLSGAGVAAAAGAVALPALAAAAVAVPLAYGLSKAVGYDPAKDKSRANMRAGTRGAYQGPKHTYGPAGVSAQDTVSAFTAMGYGKGDAAAIAAQIQAESGGNPFNPGDYVNGKPTAFGLIQAHPDRQANYAKLYGHTMQSVTDRSQAIREQYGFVDWELHNTEKHAFGKLEEAQGPYAKGAALSRYYERPGAVDQAAANRGASAAAIDASTTGSAVATQMAGAGATGQPGAGGATGKVDVTIRSIGQTPQQVTASSTGNVNQPKIASTAVGAGNGGA